MKSIDVKRSPKILFIFPRFNIGGVTKALSFVANTCDKVGMEVYCVALKKEPETVHLNPGIHRYAFDVIGNHGIRRIVQYGIFIPYFRIYIRKLKPDVIIVFRADLVNAIVNTTWGINVPIIGSERGNPFLYSRSLFNKYRKAFGKASAIVYQTEAAYKAYNINGKYSIIPNPGITRDFNILHTKVREGKNIITVSRLSKEKNIDGLLRAFAMAKNYLTNRYLYIYGDGPEQAHLEQLAEELCINNNVIFAGNVSDFTKQEDDSSIFILNSLSEGMPNALIEAMVTGYTCICTDCPIYAPRWLSDGGRRVRLVPVKDDHALSEAIIEMIVDSNKAKYLAKNALEIIDVLNPNFIGDMWLKLIREVVYGHYSKD